MALNVAHSKNSSVQNSVSSAEWQARVDLAAAHRYYASLDYDGGLFNHISLRIPDAPSYFLIKPHDVLFEEVTASCLIKIDLNGEPVGYAQNVNEAGYTIHSAVLAARKDVNAVSHIHTVVGEAISIRKGGLRCLTQGSMRFYNRLGYHNFEGVAEDTDERARLARDLGPHMAMILRNHGLLTCGTTMAHSVSAMTGLIAAAEAQLRIEASGAEINEVPPEVCEKAAQRFDRGMPGDAGWRSILRQMDRLDPSYRD